MAEYVIHCVIDFFTKPASGEKVRSILMDLLEPTRKEEGCLKYKLFENLQDLSQFTIIGAWENEDAFDDHLQSEHYKKADADIQADLVKTTDIKRYKYIQTDPSKLAETKASGFCLLI